MKRGLVVLGGIVAALGVWLVADPVLGVDLTVNAQTVGAAAVVVVAAVAGLAACGVVALLERTVRRPRPVWIGLGSAVLLVSLFGPLGAGTAGAVGALAAMHLAVGGVLIPLLARTLPATPRPADTVQRRVEPARR